MLGLVSLSTAWTLSFSTLVTTICNPPLLLSTTHHPAVASSPAHLSISCPVLREEDETQPSFLRSLEACVFSFAHQHTERAAAGISPAFILTEETLRMSEWNPGSPDPQLLLPHQHQPWEPGITLLTLLRAESRCLDLALLTTPIPNPCDLLDLRSHKNLGKEGEMAKGGGGKGFEEEMMR